MMVETMARTNWYAVQTYSGHENKVQKPVSYTHLTLPTTPYV